MTGLPTSCLPGRESGGTIVVLGGSGLIGQALAARWPAEEKRRLRLLFHKTQPRSRPAANIEHRQVDIGSTEDLRLALDGATTVIDLLRPTGDGTRRLAGVRLGAALRGSAVRRVLHASSIDVYGRTKVIVVDGATPPEPDTEYAREHLASERLAADRPVSTTILRLGAVFGPGSRNLVALAAEVAVAPIWRLAARRSLNGTRRFHLVSVETVTEILLAMIHADDAPPRLVVTDDAAPENNFAYAQDLAIAACGRPDISGTPILPRPALRAALALRGYSPSLACRRFSEPGLGAIGERGAAGFPGRLKNYVDGLAIQRGEDRR
ncbi:NAD-dependent epimerase/dehydratase family protein [Mesorhizobium sp. 1B3]|uniref:NAD-dependent epimerase/dehydratase family protein n=1 Tax=Mesorhizobium sp. 1B3 TaxID=3243599 RepID=UPI003D99ED6B